MDLESYGRFEPTEMTRNLTDMSPEKHRNPEVCRHTELGISAPRGEKRVTVLYIPKYVNGIEVRFAFRTVLKNSKQNLFEPSRIFYQHINRHHHRLLKKSNNSFDFGPLCTDRRVHGSKWIYNIQLRICRESFLPCLPRWMETVVDFDALKMNTM
jgi:hypothetical protein